MFVNIESGIPGFDQLTEYEDNTGGLPLKSSTLLFGPPKTGKSIFCNQFSYHGLSNGEPCLYVTTDYGYKQLQNNMMDFQWFIQNYIQDQSLYIIDGISHLSGAKPQDAVNIKTSMVGNPADMMVKVGIGTRSVYKKATHFRSILDSLNTLLAFNKPEMVLRVLNAYIRRISEAGGCGIIAYTQGIANRKIEEELIGLFDNIIKLDGENIIVKTYMEDFDVVETFKSEYSITDTGIVISK